MATLYGVYRKFGEASEAAQLLETELGTMLLLLAGMDEGLLDTTNPERGAELLQEINSRTLGQLLKRLSAKSKHLSELQALLSEALEARNRLSHSFFREHNFRRNSDEGRTIMLEDLEAIHTSILGAYKALMLLSGVDLDCADISTPTAHLPI